MDTGELAITWIVLFIISWLELQIQDDYCNSVRAYIASLITIVILNIAITAVALSVMFGSVTGLSALVMLLASMAFPLTAGIRKIPRIQERHNAVDQANTIIRWYGGNDG